PSLVVTKAPCPLAERRPVGVIRRIVCEECKQCRKCLRLGCPAIEQRDTGITINEHLCSGCGLCEQLCPFHAIVPIEADS
ncbi:MAG: 4Fe-4S binding protein, partial [Kiritimatiellia bacterium]